MAKKIKVMHLLGTFNRRGGCEQMIATTARGLQARGALDNRIYLMSDLRGILDEAEGVRVDELRILKSDFYPITAIFRLYEFPFLVYYILRDRPDVIFAYQCTEDKLLAAIAGRILGPRVVIRKCVENKAQTSAGLLADRIIYRLCDKIVALHRDGRNELITGGVSPDKIAYIPNGKRIMDFESDISKKEAKERLGLNETDFVIGLLSRLDPVKGHAIVIRALPDLIKVKGDVKFVIAGEDRSGKYRKDLDILIKRLDVQKNVLFIGQRRDVAEVLAAFDVFVHPSYSDSNPGAVLEAMCAGLPIIASEAGGTRETLADAGVIVPIDDEKAIFDALVRFIDNPRLRADYEAKAKVRAMEYSVEKMLTSYETLFLGFVR